MPTCGARPHVRKYFQESKGANVGCKEPNRQWSGSKAQKAKPIMGHTLAETTKDPIILLCEAKKGLDQNQLVECSVSLSECTPATD